MSEGLHDEYDIKSIEPKWQDWWEEEKIYHFEPESDKPIYSIDNPPRYANAPLHLGHATSYTQTDFIARYKRMRGYNVFFPLCADVNGMPIEVSVEKKYKVTKRTTDRQTLIKLCREFAKENIRELILQFKMLGMCMDPSIYYQTDEDYYRRLTQISFIRMFKDGLVYKKEYPVAWCPYCGTALASADIVYEPRKTKLNYIKFRKKLKSDKNKSTGTVTDDFVVIATTRPELLCTCQLVAVNPTDDTHNKLIGSVLTPPLYDNIDVVVVGDEKVDPSFGTGVVMICSIGDKDDLEWIARYDLKFLKGIDEDGKMTALSGKYRDLSICEAREAIIADLKSQDLLVKQEDLEQNVGTCWRCHTPVEFLSVPQWFLKSIEFKSDILRIADEINWHPSFMKTRLENWTNSLTWDWCISRQRYFATPIPIWECTDCGEIILAREEDCYVDPTRDPPPVERCPTCSSASLKGCEDVFDTWMDSSITPLYNAYWLRDNTKFTKLYPMSLRPQSHDIIRTWAFYTILRGYLLTDRKPWDDIMICGFIMAPDGTPMHSSRGNVIDPLPIVAENGADAFRYYATTCPLGMDTAFQPKEVAHGRKLCNKLWNIEKLVGKVIIADIEKLVALKSQRAADIELHPIDRWILSKYSKVVANSIKYMDAYLYDKTVRELEYFIWHEFADHYLELVKHRIYREPDISLIWTLYTIGLGVIKMLAPFLPHITEELYQKYYHAIDGMKSIHISSWPEVVLTDLESEKTGELVKRVVSEIRRWKSERGMPLNAQLGNVNIVIPDELDAERLLQNHKLIAETIHVEKLNIVKREEVHKTMREVIKSVRPKLSKLGPTYRAQTKEIVTKLKSIESAELTASFGPDGKGLKLRLDSGAEIMLTNEFVELEKVLTVEEKEVEYLKVGDILITIM